MKVLIVDDEINICTLIHQLIEWDKLGLTFVGRAANGNEALKMISEAHPDIVITDIRMPGMDGLELVKQGSTLYEDKVKFVIISGHKQFDYAYEAIKYGVVDFLLKPVNKAELNQVLSRLVKIKRNTSSINFAPQKHDSIVRNQFLINLIYNVDEVLDLSLEEINSRYLYKFSEGSFLPGIIILDNYDNLDSLQKEVSDKIKESFYEAFTTLSYDLALYQNDNKFFFILNYDDEKQSQIHQQIENLLKKIQVKNKPFHLIKTTIGLGLKGDHTELKENILLAKKAINSRSMVVGNKIIDFKDYEDVAELPVIYVDIEAKEKAQELLDKDLAIKHCEEYFKRVLLATKKSPYQVIPLVMQEVLIMIMGGVKYHMPEQAANFAATTSEYSFEKCLSPQEVLDHMKNLILLSYDQIIKSRQSEDSKIIKTVKEYIIDNMNIQVSLEEVSKQVYLSPAYLGILFKKETGELFSQYATNVKMAKAKEYLREMDSSIKEIASKLGYKDIRNFSKLFRNTVGVKPTEYRKLYHMD